MMLKITKLTSDLRLKKNRDDYIKRFNPRLLVLSVLLIGLFLIVWINLFLVQVVRNEEYAVKLANFTKTYQNMASPRGEIRDRNGEILVANQERLAIVYYPPLNITSAQEWELAYQFAEDFEVDISSLTQRDLKDVYLVNYPKETTTLITDDEWDDYYDGKINDSGIYQLKIERLTSGHLGQLTQEMIKAYQVKQAMNQVPRFSLKTIKDKVSIDEISYLIANSSKYRGFDVHVYFDRSYPYDNMLRGLLGGVTSSRQGLLSERLNYFLALGYSRNSSMGRSGVEYQYESLLKGEDTAYSVDYNEQGLAIFDEAIVGTKGQDIRTSIDVNLQLKVEEIISNNFIAEANNPYQIGRAHV